MTLDEALACNDRGIARARQLGACVSLVVVDEFGQLVQLDRMDGAALMSPDLAEAKALTALNFKRPTSEVKALDETELQAIAQVVHFRVVAIAGGVPIYAGPELKGAVGVSGASAEQEEDIARAAAGAR